MKKTLLIKAKDIYSYAVTPNLGLGYLASALRQNNYEPVILDCNKNSMGADRFEEYLGKNKDFHLVGFQLYTNALPAAKKMVEITRRILKDAIIVLGGPHPSGDPLQTLEYFKDADCVVVGEGELVLPKLMELSREEANDVSVLSSIKNLAFRNKEGGVSINEKAFINDLDNIPFPAWDLIDPRTYPDSPHGTFGKAFPVAPIITSRGCPFLCTFCAGFQTTGRKMRRKSPEKVLEEMEFLYNDYGVREFHIEDDNFTFQKDYVMKVAQGILDLDLKIFWACPNGIRLDKVDREMLVLMEKSGCYSIGVGIESGSDRVLKSIKKKLNIEEIEKKISLIKETTDIHITGFFLLGYPGETEEDIEKTLSFSKRLKLDKASFSPVMPLPGSEIYYEWKKKVGTDGANWDKFLYYQIVPLVSDISEKKLKRYIKKAVIGFYTRFSVITGILKEIKSFYQFKVVLKRVKTLLCG